MAMELLKITHISRPGYKAVQMYVSSLGTVKQYNYGSIDEGQSRFLEIYQGVNYIPDSKNVHSRSWHHKEYHIPNSCKDIVSILKPEFDKFIKYPGAIELEIKYGV